MNFTKYARLAAATIGCWLGASVALAQQQAPPAPSPTPQQQKPAEQEPPPTGGDDKYHLVRTTNEVDLIFTVTDHKGQFVTKLQQQDFGLLDDGRPPLRVISFKQQTNLPLRVGIMMDTSSSIRQRFIFEQQAATDFLLQVMHPDDRAFVEGFDVQTNIAQDFTNRVDLLDSGIRRLRPGGGTALFDSLYKTCRDQMLTLRDPISTRKAIVLVSDGDDDYSRALITEAIKMCQRAETIVATDFRRHRRPRLLPHADGRCGIGLPEHRSGAAQPVLAAVRSGRLQGRRSLPHDLPAGTGQAVCRAGEEGLLCPEGSTVERRADVRPVTFDKREQQSPPGHGRAFSFEVGFICRVGRGP
jgi:hypothetical protein